MRLWLSKNSGISLKDQLTRQIILAIISGDLSAGAKLPSVRELGRRYGIHPNTAAAAYRSLEENGWTESRSGSGVYVKTVSKATIDRAADEMDHDLDEAIALFLRNARTRGFSGEQIRVRFEAVFDAKKPQSIEIFEPDHDLALILEHEISSRFALPVSIVANNPKFANEVLVVSITDLPANISEPLYFVKLKLNSVQASMKGKERPEKTDMVGVVSHWETFRRWSQTMLVAVGIDEDNLVVRDTSRVNWRDGLRSCKLIIADALTAKSCHGLKTVSIFPLVSEESFEEMRAHFDEC